MQLTRIVLASRNKGKIHELENIFSSMHCSFDSLDKYPDIGEIPETGNTFEENALIKAKTVFELVRVPVISDDSGLAVEQLNWNPGVFSARFAGENASDSENNNKLIRMLTPLPEPHRAKYVYQAMYYDGVNTIQALGEVYGHIIHEPRGGGGFGYDPYFIPEGYTQTMAELSLGIKNSISHRGKAFRTLYKQIAAL